ncbi:hypothetical protein G6F35_012942 [Rhizopus arrhizus]|nr:hypothetical protein G6F35_012942 [Rhizopus arrhizus]
MPAPTPLRHAVSATTATALPPAMAPAAVRGRARHRAPGLVNVPQYSLSWSAPANSESFVLEESANGGGWTVMHNGAANSFGASRGKGSYAYRVRACNFVGCSPYSGVVTVAVVLPPAATSLYLAEWLTTRRPPYQVQCSAGWSPVADATEYQLESGGGGQRLYTGPSTYVNDSGGTWVFPVVGRTAGHPRCTELGLSHERTLFAVESSGTRAGGAGGLFGAGGCPGGCRVHPHRCTGITGGDHRCQWPGDRAYGVRAVWRGGQPAVDGWAGVYRACDGLGDGAELYAAAVL